MDKDVDELLDYLFQEVFIEGVRAGMSLRNNRDILDITERERLDDLKRKFYAKASEGTGL